MKTFTAAPGLPDIEEFPDAEPTSCIVEGILKRLALPMMEETSRKVKIVLAPVDFLDLHEIQSWSEVFMDASFDDGEHARATIGNENSIVCIKALSRKKQWKQQQPLTVSGY